MSELMLSMDALETEIRGGKSYNLVDPIFDARHNLLLGTEKVLTEKDLNRARDRCPELKTRTFLVRKAAAHFIDEDKRVKWGAYLISIFEGADYFSLMSRPRKDFIVKYLKQIIIDQDYLIWKISLYKAHHKKVFDQAAHTCFIALSLYYTNAAMLSGGMIDAIMIEKIVAASLLYPLGMLKREASLFERKRMDIAPNNASAFYQYPLESYKLLRAEADRHAYTDDVLDAIMNAEERVDGTGAPRGVDGDDLSFLARLVGLSGYFYLLMSGELSLKPRPYRDYVAKLRMEKTKFDGQLLDSLENTFKYLYQV